MDTIGGYILTTVLIGIGCFLIGWIIGVVITPDDAGMAALGIPLIIGALLAAVTVLSAVLYLTFKRPVIAKSILQRGAIAVLLLVLIVFMMLRFL